MRKPATFLILALLISALPVYIAAQSREPADPRPGERPSVTAGTSSATSSRIRGKVMADGRPVADVAIMAFPINLSSNAEGAMTSLLRPVTSDADGKFELTGLQAGAYSISGTCPGYVTSDEDSKEFFRPGDNVTITLVKGGVITGRVTNSLGDPVVGAAVRAIKVREIDNKRPRVRVGVLAQLSNAMSEIFGPPKTDDRGIYRIYGLTPGHYQVAAGGAGGQGFAFGGATAYDGDAPTYYPSGTLDTAAEVLVRAGEEANNIDIRYRENRGYSVSGSVSVSAGPVPPDISLLLTRANGAVEATTTILSNRNEKRFTFSSLAEGDYFVTAMGGANNLMSSAEGLSASVSKSRRITVRGADVTGIELVLEPLASISGRTNLEPLQDLKQKPACKDARPVPLEGVVLTARDERAQALADPFNILGEFKKTTPNDKGEFVIPLLPAGVHRMYADLPGDNLYFKSAVLTPPEPNAKPIDVSKGGITIKSGDKIKGLVLTISEGAAGLQGKVVTGAENKPPDGRLRAHLVPSEPDAADAVLRYAEAPVSADGTFAMTNLAPGKYWLVAREVTEQDPSEDEIKPLAWEAAGRTALRFEGEASRKVIELTHCQRLTDFVLSYAPLIKPSKPAAKKPAM